jgi:hypothetical protein
MNLVINFKESNQKFNFNFKESEKTFAVNFGEVHEVSNPDIPSDYGKITYTQEKIIIVT